MARRVPELADGVYALSGRGGFWRLTGDRRIARHRVVSAWLDGRPRSFFRDEDLAGRLARLLGRDLVSDDDLLYCDGCGGCSRSVVLDPAGGSVLCRSCAAG